MKKIFYFLFLTGLVASIASCEKDGDLTRLKDPVPPAVTASASSLVLTESTAADTVQHFSLTPADYGFDAAVSYTLQIALEGTSFATPKEVTLGSGLRLSYTGADLNQLALLQGIPAGNQGRLEVRVRSVLSDSIRHYSAPISFAVTPYLVIINYPSLWVPGNYQGWTPATAEKISSKLGNGVYEGYVNIPSGPTFKYTSEPDWDHVIYGYASSSESNGNVSGTFNTTGGDLYVPSTGYYLLKANTNDNTWSGTKINNWNMTGDFNAWQDEPMTYDATTKKWTGTLNAAAAGIFKFRANNAWTINFGDTGADRSLEYDGADITVSAGSHTVTLDISVPGNYTYKIQ